MRSKHCYHSYAFLLCVYLIFLQACVTTVSVASDANEKQIIHAAQIAFNDARYDEALQYYQILIDRHGEDPVIRLTADYEIAYIHYVSKDYDIASEQFLAIQRRYEEGEYRESYPLWPLILTERILETLNAE